MDVLCSVALARGLTITVMHRQANGSFTIKRATCVNGWDYLDQLMFYIPCTLIVWRTRYRPDINRLAPSVHLYTCAAIFSRRLMDLAIDSHISYLCHRDVAMSCLRNSYSTVFSHSVATWRFNGPVKQTYRWSNQVAW